MPEFRFPPTCRHPFLAVLTSAFEETQKLASGAIDLLINNAGVIGPTQQSTLEMDFAGFSDALAVSTLGPRPETQALLPNVKLRPGAKVVVLTSPMGSLSYAKSDRVAYRASKAAANKATQCLPTDLKIHGVAVAATVKRVVEPTGSPFRQTPQFPLNSSRY
jgi:NAD(P)-dependent dehydrogenase (short-subunit alcohol dehydrogenase family)